MINHLLPLEGASEDNNSSHHHETQPKLLLEQVHQVSQCDAQAVISDQMITSIL
jgi:hypothetical protein